MTNNTIYLTDKGFKKIESELEFLRTQKRPDLLAQLQESQGGSDWMENTDHIQIREELAYIDARIQELEYTLKNGNLIEPGHIAGQIEMGSTAVIQPDEGAAEEYTIVGAAEANPAEGLISNESPLGKALLDHKVGDVVQVEAPGGTFTFQIIAVTDWPQKSSEAEEESAIL